MFVVVDDRLAGLVAVADPIKDSTLEALRRLREDGIRVVMLTGDSRTTAEAVARTLAIDQVEAEVLPDQKAAVVKQLQGEGRIVAMAGDGINDAPALAQAHVGIAMGTGTDVAMESADVTLVKGDLRGIVRARALSRATMRNIRQNLFFAFVYNALGVPLAAGVLYPVLGPPPEPDGRERRHDLQLGLGDRQRAAPPPADALKRRRSRRRAPRRVRRTTRACSQRSITQGAGDVPDGGRLRLAHLAPPNPRKPPSFAASAVRWAIADQPALHFLGLLARGLAVDERGERPAGLERVRPELRRARARGARPRRFARGRPAETARTRARGGARCELRPAAWVLVSVTSFPTANISRSAPRGPLGLAATTASPAIRGDLRTIFHSSAE